MQVLRKSVALGKNRWLYQDTLLYPRFKHFGGLQGINSGNPAQIGIGKRPVAVNPVAHFIPNGGTFEVQEIYRHALGGSFRVLSVLRGIEMGGGHFGSVWTVEGKLEKQKTA